MENIRLIRRRNAAGTTHELPPTTRLDDKKKEKLQKLAIKCWIMPRLSPGEAMICK